MKLKIALATATALGLCMGTAWAGSANTLYISQDGTANTSNIHQSGTSATAGTGNDIGQLHAPVKQDGKRNYFGYTNAGYGAGSDNDIVKLRQDGNDNWFQVMDSGGAVNTRINNVSQDGNNNQLSITRAAEQSSTIDRVLMDGNDNNVWVRQGPIYRSGIGYGPAGGHNLISLVKVDGSGNGGANPASPGDVYASGIKIQQTGSATSGGVYNTITEASIEGNNNPSHFGHAISIYQEGSYNGRNASIARMKGSNGNDIMISEIGDRNDFDVRQGVSRASTGNFATVSQTGSYNSATATQYGNNNSLMVNQIDNNNTSITRFTGNDNGNGSFSGAANTLASAALDLTQGVVLQDSTSAGSGNLLDYNVYGSRNLFAFAQMGGNNTINGHVGTGAHDSNDNQVAVLQNGNSNTSNFSQTGGSNNLAVSQ